MCALADSTWSADEIARLCYNRFDELPKRGKPEPGREWTLLAAVVKVSEAPSQGQPGRKVVEKEVVSLGTGTKCIGQSAMSPRGDVLNDSHAEIIARRGFVRYLTEELRRAVVGEGSRVFCPGDERGKWRLLDGVSFLFFTSHTPCGDASIIPMIDSQSQPCLPIGMVERADGTNEAPAVTDGGGTLKRQTEGEEGGACKRPRLDTEEEEEKKEEAAQRSGLGTSTGRGAKCVPGPRGPPGGGAGVPQRGGAEGEAGRGGAHPPLSCSDKLARWAALGCQGALLSHYLQGRSAGAVVTGKCPYSPVAMERALISSCFELIGSVPVINALCRTARCVRLANEPDPARLPSAQVCAGNGAAELQPYELQPPQLLQSGLEFAHSQAQTERSHRQGQGRVSPCGAAISWCAVTDQPLDVTANGYKQGVTRKALGTDKSRSSICKAELFRCFLNLLAVTADSQLPQSLRGKELQTYWDHKQAAQTYQQAWLQLRTQAFPLWLRSPRDLLLFH
ncbi:hypothetical protein ANANG_G00208860 [Anguilla anguilla]|uniref:tRNA-specific adenosine deaminase 1 n=1 Tax=Anguilla anguilla TaxID=7936 RepID=A0A9D3RUA2_ANGAN|nr:hypothetical protein ANANG_G00208860 [Anguilla anguilla]